MVFDFLKDSVEYFSVHLAVHFLLLVVGCHLILVVAEEYCFVLVVPAGIVVVLVVAAAGIVVLVDVAAGIVMVVVVAAGVELAAAVVVEELAAGVVLVPAAGVVLVPAAEVVPVPAAGVVLVLVLSAAILEPADTAVVGQLVADTVLDLEVADVVYYLTVVAEADTDIHGPGKQVAAALDTVAGDTVLVAGTVVVVVLGNVVHGTVAVVELGNQDVVVVDAGTANKLTYYTEIIYTS